jgi:hypothetical protein
MLSHLAEICKCYNVNRLCLILAFEINSILQAERVRDAAWGCDWIGTPIAFQKCIILIIAAANKEFTFTAGKFVPVTIRTMVNVRLDSK